MDGQVLSTTGCKRVRGLRARRVPEAEAFVLHLVSVTRGVPEKLIFQPSRGDAGAADARHLAMYLMNVILQTTLTDIGRLFGRDRTTIRHACARIEDKRDDPRFETLVMRLEAEIERWMAVQRGRRMELRRA